MPRMIRILMRIGSSLDLIKQAYGLSFDEDGTSVRTMDMDFENSGGSTLAYVQSSFSGNKTVKLSMRVNMGFYNALNQTDVNGSTTTPGRVILIARSPMS